MMRFLQRLSIVAPCLASACMEPSGILVTPVLRSVHLDVRDIGHEVVRVSAKVEGPFDGRDRVELRLITSNGDEERVLLGPDTCGNHACDQFMVSMRDGQVIEELRPRASAIGGMLRVGGIAGESGTTVHRPTWFGVIELDVGANLNWAMEQARRWPGVKNVELESFGTTAGLPQSPAATAGAHGRVFTSQTTAAARPGDGKLQWRAGVTLTAEYSQPGGEVLTARASIL